MMYGTYFVFQRRRIRVDFLRFCALLLLRGLYSWHWANYLFRQKVR